MQLPGNGSGSSSGSGICGTYMRFCQPLSVKPSWPSWWHHCTVADKRLCALDQPKPVHLQFAKEFCLVTEAKNLPNGW
jgi:hypothetical protein